MPVFKGVKFTLNAGDCMTITGANGSGKSSLLRVIAGLLKPSTGQAVGYDTTDIHYIGTQSALRSVLTLQENMKFWGKTLSSNPAQIQHSLDAMNITHLAKNTIAQLSSGQAKRASLARLFLTHRPIWLLDEPENALDKKHREHLKTKIKEHIGKGGIVIIATHNADIWPSTQNLDMDQFTRSAA